MWAPLPPAPPERGWWTGLPTELDYWVEGVRDGLRAERAERAERIERLKAVAHRIDMKVAGALSRDRWERIQRRRELRGAIYRPGVGLVDQWGAREVEHRGGGQILSVR